MPINSITFATKFASELDKVLTQKSQAAMLEDSKFGARFVGARTVSIPEADFVGLGDYNRDSGFPNGAVSVSHKTYTLSQDRGRTFSIDREDMDETGVVSLAGQVMSEFVRTKVAPEIDAYTFSKLYGVATDTTGGRTAHKVSLPTGKTLTEKVYTLITDILDKVENETGYNDEEILLYVDPTVYKALMATEELDRYIRTDEFKKGEITTKVQRINNAIVIPVSAARMKTAYTFDKGATASAGGFEADSNASSIGIIALPKSAAKLVKKSEKIRVFSPDVNQKADAYKFDYRLYYDVFVKDSQKNTIWIYSY